MKNNKKLININDKEIEVDVYYKDLCIEEENIKKIESFLCNIDNDLRIKENNKRYFIVCTDSISKAKIFIESTKALLEKEIHASTKNGKIKELKESNEHVLIYEDFNADNFIEDTKEIEKSIIISVFKKDFENIKTKLENNNLSYDYIDLYIFEYVTKKEERIRELVNNTKPTKNEKNILLLAMSTIPKQNARQVSRYCFDKENIDGYYLTQLEPIPKMLAEKLARTNEKLDTVFVLNTEESLTNKEKMGTYQSGNLDEYNAFTYFSERCSFVEEIVGINLFAEGSKKIDIEKAINEFYNKIIGLDTKINLYVDIHGGPRDFFTVVDTILMLLKDMKNINLENIYTVEYGDATVIRECKDQFNVFDFVNGMNEFLNYGRSAGLEKFININGDTKYKALVDAINSISDGILLNRTNLFKDNLLQLKNNIDSLSDDDGYFNVVKKMIVNDYKVTINNKRYNLLEVDNDRKELIAQLQWCLNKKHYQQALILIENRSAGYLFDKKIIEVNSNINNKNEVANETWGNWAKFSLCIPECTNREWNQLTYIDTGKKNKDGKKIFNENTKTITQLNSFYFKEYFEHFNKINILDYIENGELNNDKVIAEISSLKNKSYKTPQLYRKNKLNERGVDCIKTNIIGEKRAIYYYDKDEDIPINGIIKNDNESLKKIYVLLYVYKGLKKYRNTVAHPNITNENTQSGDLSVYEVGMWIQLYINLLKDVIDIVDNSQKNIFVNCSNHPSNGWQDTQKNEAMKYGEIIDVSFPNVDWNMNDEEIDALVEDTYNKIMLYKPTAVMCMGEFVTSFKIISKLKEHNVTVLASKTARVTKEVKDENGVTTKMSLFDFKGFKEY